MATRVLKLEDFGAQKLSENQQKIVRGGDGNPITNPIPPAQESDPGKGGGGSGGPIMG